MKALKTLTVSIIIPAYNEEQRLAACLDSIAAQTVMPSEVIVVDNNSTDQTVAICRRYKFVKVIHEKKQGQSYARNAGFDSAKSDILGRINADVMLDQDWVEKVQQNFTNQPIDALMGSGRSSLLPRMKRPRTTMWVWLYYLWMKGIFRTPILWGANMCVSRKSWQQVRTKVINDNQKVHEDQDIGLCVLESGGVVGRDDSLLMSTGEQTYHYFPKLVSYTTLTYRTKKIHAQRPAFKKLKRTPPLWLVAIGWLFIGTLILPIFFGFSLIFWPIDFLMKWIVKDNNWLS